MSQLELNVNIEHKQLANFRVGSIYSR